MAEQIEKYLSHPHENTTNIMDGNSKPSSGMYMSFTKKWIKQTCRKICVELYHKFNVVLFYDSVVKGDKNADPKNANDLVQTLSLFLEVPNLRDCVSISTVVHATISYLFSRHFPAFSVPRPILKVYLY